MKLQTSKCNSIENEDFIILSERLANLAGSIGIRHRPFDCHSLKFFSVLPSEHKLRILDQLAYQLVILDEAQSEGESIVDAPRLLWRCLKKLGLRPCSDLFNHITKEDIVEIYGCDHFQVFRNLKFFEYTSYTFEDLACRPWTELFQRNDPQVMQQLYQFAIRLTAGEFQKGFDPQMGPQLMEEKHSMFKLKAMAKTRFIAPLFTKKGVGGYLSLARGHLLTQPPVGDEFERISTQFLAGTQHV